jgi:acetyl/propionyl-CoA carboxylase alpha subunit
VRVDSSLYSGLEVTPYYDSLLAKVIVWGRDRAEVLNRLERALGEYRVLGVKTTIPLFQQLLRNEAFRSGEIDTHFLERHLEGSSVVRDEDDAALVVAAVLSHARRGRNGGIPASKANGSNWRRTGRIDNADKAGGGPWRSTF